MSCVKGIIEEMEIFDKIDVLYREKIKESKAEPLPPNGLALIANSVLCTKFNEGSKS